MIVPGDASALVEVRRGGKAELFNLRFETSAQADRALLADGGAIDCSGCLIDSAHDQPIEIRYGSLHFRGGSVTGAGQHVISAYESAVNLEDTQVHAPQGHPLSIERAGPVRVLQSSLTGQGRISISGGVLDLNINGSDIAISDSYGLSIDGAGGLP